MLALQSASHAFLLVSWELQLWLPVQQRDMSSTRMLTLVPNSPSSWCFGLLGVPTLMYERSGLSLVRNGAPGSGQTVPSTRPVPYCHIQLPGTSSLMDEGSRAL